jgi:hypothetical protein
MLSLMKTPTRMLARCRALRTMATVVEAALGPLPSAFTSVHRFPVWASSPSTPLPPLTTLWWTYNVFDSSHSDAWIGLYVGAYDLNSTFISAPIDQQISLWDESHNFLDNPDGSGSNSGYGLNSATFVNDQEFYEIWVWCGGSAWGDGDHTLWGSWGGSSLGVAVPWIHLEYFGGGG